MYDSDRKHCIEVSPCRDPPAYGAYILFSVNNWIRLVRSFCLHLPLRSQLHSVFVTLFQRLFLLDDANTILSSVFQNFCLLQAHTQFYEVKRAD